VIELEDRGGVCEFSGPAVEAICDRHRDGGARGAAERLRNEKNKGRRTTWTRKLDDIIIEVQARSAGASYTKLRTKSEEKSAINDVNVENHVTQWDSTVIRCCTVYYYKSLK
jgi:hypothetical protein